LKILSAIYGWVDGMVPGMLLELELETDSGPVKVTATISEESVRPVLFDHGLIYLQGTSLHHMELLRKHLTPKEIPGHPGEFLDSVTDDPKILGLVRHFLDAINSRNGAQFVEHASLPPSLFS
jgi:hypothetical protein